MVTHRLSNLDVVAFSGFTPTHIKGRCLDYIFGSLSCKRLYNVSCRLVNELASDHSAFDFSLSRRLTIEQPASTPRVSPASTQVTTFRLGRSCTTNPLIVHSALDILFKLLPTLETCTLSPAARIALFSLLVFSSFKAATHLLEMGRPPYTPTYT